MSLRVVLYGEGSGDTGGEFGLQPPPGCVLVEDNHFGPAHFLVRRILAASNRGLPEGAIRFEGPLRTRGRIARGTQLYNPSVVHQLVNGWFDQTPELVIILFDSDGEAGRKSQLEAVLADSVVPHVLGMAVQEFEAWLIADAAALKHAGCPIKPRADPEQLSPREAKQLLAGAGAAASARNLRCTLAKICDLDTVASRCPSFAEFRRDADKRA